MTFAVTAYLPLFVIRQDQEPIVTDRPDFTESSYVVPLGMTQLESGLTLGRDGDESAVSGPELLVRLSLSKRWEIRAGLPDYRYLSRQGVTTRGFDDLSVGAKYQVGPVWGGTGLALIPSLSFPVGSPETRSESVVPGVQLVWSRALACDRSLSGMVAWSRSTEGSMAFDAWQHTLSLGMPVSGSTGLFVEHVLDVANGSRPEHLVHAGVTFQPAAHMQFDLHFGFGLGTREARHFVGAGFAIRTK